MSARGLLRGSGRFLCAAGRMHALRPASLLANAGCDGMQSCSAGHVCIMMGSKCSTSTNSMQRQAQQLRAHAPFLDCRWRLFSLAQEDSMRSWKVEPFQLVEGAAR